MSVIAMKTLFVSFPALVLTKALLVMRYGYHAFANRVAVKFLSRFIKAP